MPYGQQGNYYKREYGGGKRAVGLHEGDFVIAVNRQVSMDTTIIVQHTFMGETSMLSEYRLDGVRMDNYTAWHYLVDQCGFTPTEGLEYMASLTMDAMACLQESKCGQGD